MLLLLIPNKAWWISLIRNTVKCRMHDRLFHFGEWSMLLQREKSSMRDVKCSSQRCEGSFFALQFGGMTSEHTWGCEIEEKNLKIMHLGYCNFFSFWRAGNVENKHNSSVNIRFFAKASDTKNFFQNIRSDVKTSEVATLRVIVT